MYYTHGFGVLFIQLHLPLLSLLPSLLTSLSLSQYTSFLILVISPAMLIFFLYFGPKGSDRVFYEPVMSS